MKLHRRAFLLGATATLASVATSSAHAASDTRHIVYPVPQPDTASAAREHLQQLSLQLGPEVTKNLSLGVHGTARVVVYDRSGAADPKSEDAVARVVRIHDRLLRQALDLTSRAAYAATASEIAPAYNVAYGEPTSRREAERRYLSVIRHLGRGMEKGLEVQQLGPERYVLIYRRLGTEERSRNVAERHAQLLKSLSLDVRAVPEAGHPVVRDGTTAPEAEDTEIETPPAVSDAGSDSPETASTEPEEPAAASADASSDPGTGLPSVEELLAAPVDAGDATADAADTPADAADPTEDPEAAPSMPPRQAPRPGLVSGQSELEDLIERHIKDQRRRGRVSSTERTAWLVYDLHTDRTLASINIGHNLQAASMIKPFVALAFLDEVHRGRFVYGSRSKHHMERMIRFSSNTSTNWMIDQVGGPNRCHRLLHGRFGDLFDEMSLVERIPAGGRTYKNRASAADYGRFLKALWNDELPHAKELKRVMNLPSSDRLYHGVPDIPAGTLVYNKTGTTAMCCGDMGVMVARRPDGTRVPYIMVGIIERARRTSAYTSWSRTRGDVIRGVSGLTYRFLREQYGLS